MDNQFSTDQKSLSSLMSDVQSGKLQLPNFQRAYKWKTSAVLKLLDSIHKRHPAGSLLFLERSKDIKIEHEKIRTVQTAEEDLCEPTHLVLDGQQRLTSCHSVYFNQGPNTYFINLRKLQEHYKEDYEELDLLEDKIVIAKKNLDQPDRYLFENDLLPFSFLQNIKDFRKRILSYKSNLRDSGDSDVFLAFLEENLENFVDPFFDYQFPIVVLPASLTIEGICKVFQSINTTGLKLTAFDICVATFMPDKINLKAMLDDVLDKNENLQALLAGDKTLILQVIAMLSGESAKKSSLPKNLKAIHIRDEWQNAVDGLKMAVEVFDRIGVGLSYGTQLIPYYPIIPVAAATLVKKDYNSQDIATKGAMIHKIQKWYYKISFELRYTEGTDNKMKEDYSMLREWLSPDGESPFIEEPLMLSVNKIANANKNGAFGKAILTIMNNAKPNDIYTQENVGYFSGTRSQLHHIFPIGAFKEIENINSVFNFAYLSSESNQFIRDKRPSEYLTALMDELDIETPELQRRLDTHFISSDALERLNQDDYTGFLSVRIRMFINYIRDHVELDVHEAGSRETSDEFDNDDNFVQD